MRELRPGVWHWQSPHPDWYEGQAWPELVSSYGIKVDGDFLLFDPLCVPAELREPATAVVLTAPYHERDARPLGLPVHTPPADTWQDWVEKFGVDPDRVRGLESHDLATISSSGFRLSDAIVTGDSLADFGRGLDVQLGRPRARHP